MKPFFTNPFKPLITRTGQAIGKAAERTMLDAVGGPNSIRKHYQTNADGSTTMLHTQNGLARFSTTGAACNVIVGDSDIADVGTRHHVSFKKPPQSYPVVLTISFDDITAVAGVDYAAIVVDYQINAPQSHVIFVDSFTVSVGSDGGNNGAFDFIVPAYSDGTAGRQYRVHVGCAVAVGTTTVFDTS